MFERCHYHLWLWPVPCESIPSVFIIVIYSLQSCQCLIDKRLWCDAMMQANGETLTIIS